MKLLLVGPSNGISTMKKEFFAKKKTEGFTIVSFSSSLKFLLKLGVEVDYWSFIDPKTWVYVGTRKDEGGKKILTFPDLSEVSILAPNFYDDKWDKFKKSGFTSSGIWFATTVAARAMELQFRALIKNINYEATFKDVHFIKPKIIIIGKEKQENLDFGKQFYLFRSKQNVDKFSCFLLPLCFYFFNDISEIECVGFGHFGVGRAVQTKNKRGYPDFKKSFHLMKDSLKNYLEENQIDISFDGGSYFKDLKWR